MPQLDARPGLVAVIVRPGNAHTLELVWDELPAGELTAVLGDTDLGVTLVGDDTVEVEFTSDVTAELTRDVYWDLLENGQAILTGPVSPSNQGTERSRTTATVVRSTLQVAVTAGPGRGEQGPPGDSHVPDPTDEPDDRWLTTLDGALVYTDAPAGGGGAVDSVNGQTGAVVLDAGDVGADAAGAATAAQAAAVQRANHTGTQPASTISDFATAADVRIAAIVVKAFVDALNVDAATLEGETVASLTTLITAAIVDSAPGALNTLNELAAALGDDPNFATTIATALGNKAAIDGSNITAATWRTVLDVLSSSQVTTAISTAIAALSGTYVPQDLSTLTSSASPDADDVIPVHVDGALRKVALSDILALAPPGYTDAQARAAAVSDTAYADATWNGDTTHAPSMNAVRDALVARAAAVVALGGTYQGAISPATTPPAFGPELWALANFQATYNTTELSPSLTGNSTNQNKRTRISLGNLANKDTAYRLKLTIANTIPSGWATVKVLLTDSTGTKLSGTEAQVLGGSTNYTTGPWQGTVLFDFKPVAGVTGFTYLEVRIDVLNNAPSGTVTVSGASLRQIAVPQRPIKFGYGYSAISGPVVYQAMWNPVTDSYQLARTALEADGALTNSLAGILHYNTADPWRYNPYDPLFLATEVGASFQAGSSEELLGTGEFSRAMRVGNNDQIIEVLKQDGTTLELRGNTHGGETARSAATYEYDLGDGVWNTWAGSSSDKKLYDARRFRFTFPTKLTRSAPDSDDFANVDHVCTFFPDGVMRMDRTTTFLKAVTLGNVFEWMSSHDTTVPKIGRIGRGLLTLDEVDIHTKLAVPAAPTAAANNAAGSLAAGTYRYVITALAENGETTPSAAVTQAVTGGTSTVTLTLPALATGQTGWRVYGRANDQKRAVLLATVGPTATTWADDGTVPASGVFPPIVNTARRLDSATTAQDSALSDTASWAVWKDLATGTCFGNIYDRDAVLARSDVAGVRLRLEAGSGIVKNYQNLNWASAATKAIASGTVWTATHWCFSYCPADPDGRWEQEIALRAVDLDVLKTLYPAA